MSPSISIPRTFFSTRSISQQCNDMVGAGGGRTGTEFMEPASLPYTSSMWSAEANKAMRRGSVLKSLRPAGTGT